MYDYLSILIFLAVAGGFAVIFSGAAYVVAVRRSNGEKTSECGFDPFDDARSRFDVRFYLVAFTILSYGFRNLFCFPYSIALPDIGAVVIGMELFLFFY
jgi:NADH-quinone oxidoreductase subunit A